MRTRVQARDWNGCSEPKVDWHWSANQYSRVRLYCYCGRAIFHILRGAQVLPQRRLQAPGPSVRTTSLRSWPRGWWNRWVGQPSWGGSPSPSSRAHSCLCFEHVWGLQDLGCKALIQTITVSSLLTAFRGSILSHTFISPLRIHFQQLFIVH